jgi:hypothetical protein
VNGVARPAAAATGTCKNGVEFFVPDTNADPNSSETKDFYDSACTLLARDAVRTFASMGGSAESVNGAVQLYASLDVR